ncbi:flagellin [Desulforhopalus sp. 52FAK]
MDLTGMTAGASATLQFTFTGGATVDFTTAASAITGDGDMDAALNGLTATDTAGIDWVMTANSGDGSVTLTQAATDGNAAPSGGVITGVTGHTAPPTTPGFSLDTPGVAAQAEVQSFDLTGLTVADGETLTFTIDGEEAVYTNSSGGDLTEAALATDIAANIGTTGTVSLATNGDYTFTSGAGNALTMTQAAGNESSIGLSSMQSENTSVTGTYTLSVDTVDVSVAAGADGTVNASDVVSALTTAGYTASVDADNNITVANSDGADLVMQEVTTGTNTGAGFADAAADAVGVSHEGQISLDSTSDISLQGAGLAAAGLDAVGNATTTIDQVNVATREDAWVAIESVDAALSDIDTIRGGLGAVQNRFESTIANLNNVAENLSAARSRILDADIAMETSAMTKSNILQQAGVSILAQANQAPQLALSLLG